MTTIFLEIAEKKAIAVRYLQANCGVRYWEDAYVNGVQDEDGSRIPCRDPMPNDHLGGGIWMPLIDLETGTIVDWPSGTMADIHYKVCDDGTYQLLTEDRRTIVREVEGYVPSIMCPEGSGYGDYVIMKVDGDGRIANWKVDLSEFQERHED